MAAPSCLLGDRHDAVPGAGNRAPHEEKVAFGVHLDHPKAELSVALRALMTGHLLALDDARRIGAGADGAGLPVPGVAVGRRSATEAMAVDDTLESATLG